MRGCSRRPPGTREVSNYCGVERMLVNVMSDMQVGATVRKGSQNGKGQTRQTYEDEQKKIDFHFAGIRITSQNYGP